MNKLDYIREWKHCKKCPLHSNTRHHVLYRGSIPADVLFIGEAPGKTEDKLGKPFIGRSGELLTHAINSVQLSSYCITNIVCCIPYDESREHVRPPTLLEAKECSPHITQLLELCSPKLICLLGNSPKKYFDVSIVPTETSMCQLKHPAYILRQGGKNSLEFKRFMETLTLALENSSIPFRHYFSTVKVQNES